MAADWIKALGDAVGPEHLLTAPPDLVCYATDATWHEGRPEAVVLPGTAAEVAAVVAVAARHRVPLTPRGAGTGLSGGAVPARGGIVLSLARLRRICDVDERNLYAVVEPGVVTAHLQAEVARAGLYYPPDPASAQVSTLGGNIAENAGGPRCFKYGVTRDYVLGLEAVLASGQVLRTGGRTVKNVTGYDLTRLLVGSEGTLGIVTQATLRLVPPPETQATLMAVFPRLEDASRAVGDIVAAGVVPATLELMDQQTLRVVEEFLGAGLPTAAAAVLLMEVDGYADTVRVQARKVVDLCHRAGAGEVRHAQSTAEAAELWRGRKSITPALTRLAPAKVGEDIVVPPTAIPEFIRRFQYLRQKYNLTAVVYGHAGDGNLHPNVVVDPRDPQARERVEAWLGELARLALDLGGTLSGEHGIGSLKAPYLEWEVGAPGLAVMRAIKQALDPLGILNPGKMALDDPTAAGDPTTAPGSEGPDASGCTPTTHQGSGRS